jgi:predicted ATPase
MITNFKISDARIIREAACDSLPRVMFICGPNGVGKTTLLDAMGRGRGITKLPTTKVAVAPATRTWRKEVVQTRMLYNTVSSFDVLDLAANMHTYSPIFGRNVFSPIRDMWSDDDSKQLVKPLLAKLRNLWSAYLSKEIISSGFHTSDRVWPDPKSALDKFTEDMFDELRYIDTIENGEQTNVLFAAVNRPGMPPLDVDELSSGEKAIFSVFLPVIEEDFRRKMGEPRRELTLIVDEVENHLHPSLQLRMLNFMRKKSLDGYQFICTTHSTVLIKACNYDELFHVLPAGLTVGNQLRKAAHETYSLEEVMQESVLFANGFQRHIFCEGYDPSKLDENNICDSEIYGILVNSGVHNKIIASSSCDSLMAGARAAVTTLFAPLCMAAIRDNDSGRSPDVNAVWCDIVLPVYSLESLLLNVAAIHDVVGRYSITETQIEDTITQVIHKICDEEENSIVTPGAFLRRKESIQFDQAIAFLESDQVDEVFQLNKQSIQKIQSARSKLVLAKGNRELALATIKGKKIYRYLFEGLSLRARAFTQRSFAEQVAQRVKLRNHLSWLNDFERIVKRGVGNSFTQIIYTPEGEVLRTNSTHNPSIITVDNMLDKINFFGTDYAVIKDGVRLEDFAKQLAPFAVAMKTLKPDYKWINYNQ